MKNYRLNPGAAIRLASRDAGDTGDFDDKDAAERKVKKLSRELGELQYALYAEHRHKILVVLQGMDASGKDGAIRHVFRDVDPQGIRIANFKRPTQSELDHDYLWRVHREVPAKGEIVVFNRSHYEDVLVVRIHNLVPPQVWKKRFDQINAFERMLVEEGTTILKFFLHIDRKEQKARLESRLEDKKKNWKFDPGDLRERARWKDYIKAYEDVLRKTSTSWAPWNIVPANHKWYRNLVIAQSVARSLRKLQMKFPRPKQLNGFVVR